MEAVAAVVGVGVGVSKGTNVMPDYNRQSRTRFERL
jgi:hypothetical protein